MCRVAAQFDRGPVARGNLSGVLDTGDEVGRDQSVARDVRGRWPARVEGSGDDRLGHRLQAARSRSFAGRVAEHDLFRAALDGVADGLAVLYVHGPGGIGKSMLLGRFAAEARAAGRVVVEVDARILEPGPAAFEGEAAAVLTTDRAVLLVDAFEHRQGLEGWLRDRFLPRLPVGALVVIAGREAPDPRWTSDPGWSDALRVVALPELTSEEATTLLAGRGVPATLHGRLLEFAGGNPLALTLAAAVAVQDERAPSRWEPGQDVVQALLSQLVGEVPTATHRRALEVCAHVQVTTEALLRVVLGDEAGPMFAWLRQLPFVESGRYGLFPHDVVRESLEADLRWRDPEGHRVMHQLLDEHLFARIRDAAEPDVLRVTAEFAYLYRGHGCFEFSSWGGEGEVQECRFAEPDRASVVAMTAAAEGEESARIAGYWLDRQPEAFHVYRSTRTGEIAAFFAWLRLTEPGEEVDIDPVVAAAWSHARSAAPLRGGEHIALTRFPTHPAAHQRRSPVMDVIQRRAMAELFRSPDLAWSYFLLHGEDPVAYHLTQVRFTPVAEHLSVDDRHYALFAHDWRAEPVNQWHAANKRGERVPSPEASPGLAVLSRPEFDAAVRDALRSWGRPGELAANPLNRSRLVAEHGATLRGVIGQVIESLHGERNGSKYHQAVVATFLRGVPTQEAVAHRLGLPFSTYRRHLGRGIKLLCEELWRRELAGASPARSNTAGERRLRLDAG